jgi:mannose-6-phosphate isomerase-like protein (cupin superfamily)
MEVSAMGEPTATILQPGEGERVGNITFKATGADGLGHYSFGESLLPPGAPGPPLHIHNTHDEAFYIAKGVVTMRAGDDTVLAPEGTFVFVPAGVVHGFANRSDAPAVLIGIHSPGGYEQIFRELEALRGADGNIDTETAARVLPPKYNDRLVGPPLGAN